MDAGVLVEQIEDALRINKVFGEPVTVDGTTLIPAARVGGGAGGGGGRDQAKGGDGLGGGLGWTGRPYGAFVLRDGAVRWQPAVDVNRLITAVAAVAVCALLTGRTIVKVQAASRARGARS
ncbi:spore germination protein GerW family protein [Pseudonocardia sp. GCM10023141]|uniref:spore germination protein GerW family protein n=1 Tax=Pseudonocardia sp. GCM10023141 TaxID=3252653 RepID=UPI00361F9A1E